MFQPQQDVADMAFHGANGQEEPLADGLVRPAFGISDSTCRSRSLSTRTRSAIMSR